jgi:hypothetical protein
MMDFDQRDSRHYRFARSGDIDVRTPPVRGVWRRAWPYLLGATIAAVILSLTTL